MLRKFIFSLILMSLPICIMQAQDVILKADAQGNDATFADNRTNINPSTCQIVTTAEGQRAYEVEILTQSKTAYDAELKVVTTGEVSTGDVMLAKVVLRTIFAGQETGECAAHLYFQRAVSPWEKSLATQISAGSDWRTIYIPFVAKQSFAPGEAAISIAFGSLRQRCRLLISRSRTFITPGSCPICRSLASPIRAERRMPAGEVKPWLVLIPFAQLL